MKKVKRTWLIGWVMLPCFTVKILEGADGADMTCNNYLSAIFEMFFAPFWNGKIHITGKLDE